MQNISGEFLLLLITVILQMVGTFTGISKIRADFAERIARLEAHLEVITGIKQAKK